MPPAVVVDDSHAEPTLCPRHADWAGLTGGAALSATPWARPGAEGKSDTPAKKKRAGADGRAIHEVYEPGAPQGAGIAPASDGFAPFPRAALTFAPVITAGGWSPPFQPSGTPGVQPGPKPSALKA